MFTCLLRSRRDLVLAVLAGALLAVTRMRAARRARAGTELWDGRISSEDTERGQQTPRAVWSSELLSRAANEPSAKFSQSRRMPLL